LPTYAFGARISSDIDKYVNPIKNLKEQFDEHERILKGTTKQDEIFLNTETNHSYVM
jgi:hypothetical protein